MNEGTIRPGTAADEPDPIPVSPIQAVNVAQVPQRSPLRYPGGKTWLVPHIRHWLKGIEPRPKLLVEPFAGGGIVSLTAVMEGLVDRCLMVELDRDVAAFWHAALRHGPELCEKVQHFQPTREAVEALSQQTPRNILEHGFRTLVLNRTRRGGILAPGASLIRAGESGKRRGLALVSRDARPAALRLSLDQSRTASDSARRTEWYSKTLLRPSGRTIAVMFVDPPYTAGGKRAGQAALRPQCTSTMPACSNCSRMGTCDFLMTYDRAPEIEATGPQARLPRRPGTR